MFSIDPSEQTCTELRLVETAHLLSWLLQVITLTQMKKVTKYNLSQCNTLTQPLTQQYIY